MKPEELVSQESKLLVSLSTVIWLNLVWFPVKSGTML